MQPILKVQILNLKRKKNYISRKAFSKKNYGFGEYWRRKRCIYCWSFFLLCSRQDGAESNSLDYCTTRSFVWKFEESKEEPPSLSLSSLLSFFRFLSLSLSLFFLFYFSELSGGGPAPDTNRREPTVLSSTSQLAVYYLMRSLLLSPSNSTLKKSHT